MYKEINIYIYGIYKEIYIYTWGFHDIDKRVLIYQYTCGSKDIGIRSIVGVKARGVNYIYMLGEALEEQVCPSRS